MRTFLAFVLALVLVVAQGVAVVSHSNDAEASWTGCHATQAIHELSNVPSSWPGTRAAHITEWVPSGGYSIQRFFTKSGWWDPTWDNYKTSTVYC